jgi:hypothetical protein
MFDFNAISSVATSLETGIRDIDSRLEAITNLQRAQVGLLALLILHRELSGPERLTQTNRDGLREIIRITHDSFLTDVVGDAFTNPPEPGEGMPHG